MFARARPRWDDGDVHENGWVSSLMSMASEPERPGTGMAGLVVDLARPYRGWLVIILAAMLVETIAGLAGPWPLKIVIDYAVVGTMRRRLGWSRLLGPALATDGRALAAMAAVSMVLIAAIGGIAVVRRQLLHRERRAVGGERPPHAGVRPPRAPLVHLLRHAPDRTASQHDDRRRLHGAGLRLVGHAEHPRRSR